MSRFAFGTSGVAGVPGNDAYTTLLLHGDGTNGSTTIVNSAFTGGLSVIGNSGVTNSSTSPKFGAGCIRGDGTGYSQISASSLLVDRTTPFTFDFWAKPNSLIIGSQFGGYGDSSFNYYYWTIFVNSSNKLTVAVYFSNAVNINVASPAGGSIAALTDGAWHHIAFVRNGSSFQLFVDGIGGDVSTNNGTVGIDSGSGVNVFRLGTQVGTSATIFYNGYMDEVRYSHGIARWTPGTNFTPPTGPYV